MRDHKSETHRIFKHLLSDESLIRGGCWIAIISSPIYYWIWTVLFPQPYESLFLRSSACGLALFVISFTYSKKMHPYFPYIWLFSLIYVVPFSHIFLALKNQFNLVWLVCLTFVPFMLAYFVKSVWVIIATLIISAVASITLYSLIDGIPLFLLHFLDLFPLVPFILGGTLLLNHANHRALEKDARILTTRSLAGSVAHEMRNPLSQIHGNLYLIEEFQKQSPSDQDPVVTEHIKNAQKAIYNGIQLIDMTMDAINEKPIDRSGFIILSAQVIVKETIKDYAYVDDKHANKITVKGGDFQLLANPVMVKYILYNLIQNALWYVTTIPEAEVVISVLPDCNGVHCIEVRDTGPGIAPEDIPKLFDPFYTSDKRGGTGLGLSYCKRTMAALEGYIHCHSSLGQYSAFVLAFPMLSKPHKEAATTAAEPTSLAGKTVLLVEDDRTTRAIIKGWLERYDIDCVEAENGREALALFSTIACALIITDLLMPVMNGIDLIKAIRKMEIATDYNRAKPVPVLIITSEEGDLLSRALASGANTYLAKPVAADALERKLQLLL